MSNPAPARTACILLLLASGLHAQEPAEFHQRRAALMKKLDPGDLFLLRGAERATRSKTKDFRQDSDFYYLSGMREPGGIVLLHPSAQEGEREILYSDAKEEAGASGFASVRPERRLRADLVALLRKGVRRIHLAPAPRRRKSKDPLAVEEVLIEKAGKAVEVQRDARRLIAELRCIKSPAEVALLRTAIDITCEAQREAMRAASPGMVESQLQKIIEQVFRANGSVRNGFPCIIGSGPNGCKPHWMRNSRKTGRGDLVVMDVGAEYGMYSADVTRTIPIDGTFSERQRAIYEIVLRANEECIAMVRPGVRFQELAEKASAVLFAGLEQLKMVDGRRDLRRYYTHGLGHFIGLDVHDVGGLGALQPGMVFTIEPGLYLVEEGFGIRIEDDVLVTESGCEVLSRAAPKQVAEIEALMAEAPRGARACLIPKKESDK